MTYMSSGDLFCFGAGDEGFSIINIIFNFIFFSIFYFLIFF